MKTDIDISPCDLWTKNASESKFKLFVSYWLRGVSGLIIHNIVLELDKNTIINSQTLLKIIKKEGKEIDGIISWQVTDE